MPNQEQRKTITFSFDGTGNEPSDAGKFTEDESLAGPWSTRMLFSTL